MSILHEDLDVRVTYSNFNAAITAVIFRKHALSYDKWYDAKAAAIMRKCQCPNLPFRDNSGYANNWVFNVLTQDFTKYISNTCGPDDLMGPEALVAALPEFIIKSEVRALTIDTGLDRTIALVTLYRAAQSNTGKFIPFAQFNIRTSKHPMPISGGAWFRTTANKPFRKVYGEIKLMEPNNGGQLYTTGPKRVSYIKYTC